MTFSYFSHNIFKCLSTFEIICQYTRHPECNERSQSSILIIVLTRRITRDFRFKIFTRNEATMSWVFVQPEMHVTNAVGMQTWPMAMSTAAPQFVHCAGEMQTTWPMAMSITPWQMDQIQDWPKAKTIRDLSMGFLSTPPKTVEVKPIIRPNIIKLGKFVQKEEFEDVLVEDLEGVKTAKFPAFAKLNKVANVPIKATKPKALAKPIKKDISLPLKQQRGIYALETAFCSDSSEVRSPKPSQKRVR